MSDNILKRFEELVTQGSQLAPLGGFEFSGYNARLQNKYLEWRKSCLEALEQVGPIGFPYKSKILGDANGGYFFQSSAQLIVNNIKDLFEKLKASPDLAGSGTGTGSASAPGTATVIETGGGRVIKPPPKAPGAQAAAPAPAKSASAGVGKKVYIIGEDSDPLRQQLSDFLKDAGLEEVAINRQHGRMLALDKIKNQDNVRFAFFVFNSDDLAYAMFELGHFVGKLGEGRVTVLHMTDVDFPKNVPGINDKPIVVKFEEASLSILKELKASGYQVSL